MTSLQFPAADSGFGYRGTESAFTLIWFRCVAGEQQLWGQRGGPCTQYLEGADGDGGFSAAWTLRTETLVRTSSRGAFGGLRRVLGL